MPPYGPRRRQPAESLDAAPQLSANEVAAMKRLEAVWRDFGGPSASDIFVELGISVEEFYLRLYGRRSRVRPETASAYAQEHRAAGHTSEHRHAR